MKNKKSLSRPNRKDVKKNDPILTDRDVEKNPDKHIDQDFTGYPHAPATEELINPKTKEEKKSAALNIKDGEKINKKDEINSDGSANAFEATEQVQDDE